MSAVLSNVSPELRRAWHPLCRSSEVTNQPSQHRLLGVPYVAFRAPSGELRVFVDRCPHRLAPLSLGVCEGEFLRCGYHGWRFSETGRCVEIPALGPDATIPTRAMLRTPAAIAESHSMVFIAPEAPLTPLPNVLAAGLAEFQRGDLPSMTTRASAGLLADNFLDMAHFAFVHAKTFGADEERTVPNYRVVRDGFTFHATYEHQFANREDPGVVSGERPLLQSRRLTYRYTAPFHLELEIEFLDAGGSNVVGFFIVPLDDQRVTIYSSLWRNDLGGSKERMADAVAFEFAVVEEDLALQSHYERLELPLDPTVELHTRADRTTVELRRILADFMEAARD